MAKHSFIKLLLPFVFLSTVSVLNSQTLITASINTPGNAGLLSENCDGPYELVIHRGEDNNLSTEIYISGEGDAILGTDYTFAGTSFPVIMQPSDSIAVIPIFVTNDGSPEGFESVLLEIAFLAGIESDFIMLQTAIVDAYDVEIESPTDTIVWCRNVPFVLLANSTAEEIFWSPSHVFDDSLGTAATVRPFESGWYYASVGTEECGAKDSVYFNLAIAEIQNPDTVYICIDGNGVVLQGNLEGLATDFIWIPADSTLSNPEILNPIANPVVTTTYILQSDIGVCVASDRIVVRVDSLPADMHIDIAPAKPYYCAGEVVALFSPSFDTLLYPDITFLWMPDDGTFESDITLYNAGLTLQDTTLYIRDNINNACRSADSILIDVVPSAVPISVSDTMLCPGETFQVFILSNQVTEAMWTPEQGLSCTSCLDPIVTVIGTPGSSLFYQFSGKINDCPVGANLSIQIPPLEVINISGDPIVCDGDVIQLTITNGAGLSGFDWEVSGGNVTMDCDDCPNPIVTIHSIDQPITLTVSANTLNQSCGAFGTFVFSEGGTENIMIAGDSIVCDGDMVQLQITNPSGITDLTWTITTGVAGLSCNNCPNPNVTFNEVNGTVVVEVTGTSSNQDFCHAFGTFEFTEGTTNQIIVPAFHACLGENVTVSTGDPSVSDLQWTILSGTVNLSCNNCDFPVVTLNSPQSQLMFIGETTNPNFCRVSGTVIVELPEEDGASIILTPNPLIDTINQGDLVMALLSVSPSPLSVMWTLNDVNLSGAGTSIEFNAVNEVNTLVATFINSSGCEQMVSIIFNTTPPSFLIPNAFTPENGDELNNTFRVLLFGAIAVDEFLIFNRWGQLVYDAPENDLSGWDGRFKGEPAASDTYVYSAKLRFPDGHIEVAKGDVMLLR